MLFYIAYNFLILVGLLIGWPILVVWAWRQPKIKVGFWEKMGRWTPLFRNRLRTTSRRKRIWIHTVSVGELNAAKPLIALLQTQGYPIILSTTTQTGQTLALKRYSDIPVFYFPWDLPWVIGHTLQSIKPAAIVILETELWPNLLYMAKKRHIPVLLVNGRLSKISFEGYRQLGTFFGWVVSQLHMACMQSPEDAKRIMTLGVPASKIQVLPNLKYDLPIYDYTAAKQLQHTLLPNRNGRPILVMASTHDGEEDQAMKLFYTLLPEFPELILILVPRHPERFKMVAALLTREQQRFLRRTELPQRGKLPSIIVWDSMGELPALYGFATVACMGGSFTNKGGQNPLEPIHASIPVIFGPHMQNFAEITSHILTTGAGIQVSSMAAAGEPIRQLLSDPQAYQTIVEAGHRLLSSQRGSADALAQTIVKAVL